MECRANCGACCIVPSISSPIPGMPKGKPAGVKCVNLSDDFSCKIFGHPDRPGVCGGFTAEKLVCGDTQKDAFKILSELEGITVNVNDFNN
nr:YkgJ family cysteine cluster protein [uncultured Carboxylicivirga sp.]